VPAFGQNHALTWWKNQWQPGLCDKFI